MIKKVIVFVSVLSSLLTAEQLQFGETGDINSLAISRESSDYSGGSFTKVVSMNIETEEAEMYRTRQNFDLLQIKGLTTAGKAGEPTRYIKSTKVLLEKNARVTGVRLIGGNYVAIKQKIHLAPRPKPAVWMKDAKNDFTLRKDMAIYSKDAYFPGKTVSFISGRDQENRVVYIQFYPVQYNPVTMQAVIIKEARFEISYGMDNAPPAQTSRSRSDAKNIIITVPAFQTAADSLKNLHETMENITTEVVTTDWINTNYTAAANPTQPGYATNSTNPVKSNYNYDLAKKIVSFLRDNAAHPNLESITILGDADKVPPAYYFFMEEGSDLYNCWICSDLFYASPDYDMVLNYEVGRLPATDAAEAQLMFQKLKNWKTNLDASWFNNVQLVGGASFSKLKLTGEVITLDAVNKSYLKGMNIRKNYLSNGKENVAAVLSYFSDENTGIIYHIDHGHGNEMCIGSGVVKYSDLINLPAKQKYPIVVSIACVNGGYDTELMTEIPEEFDTRCFAEGVLCSKAGGIAYWGGVRVNNGAPGVSFKANGEMVVGDEPYMAGMLTNLFKAWSEGNVSFGAIHKEACSFYIQNSGLTDPMDKLTLYEFVFLGDPALSLLPQGTGSYNSIVFGMDPLPNIPGGGKSYPVYYRTAGVSIPVNISGTTSSPSVNIGIYDIFRDTTQGSLKISQLVNTIDNTPPFSYEFTPPAEKLYFAGYETADFKETRLYFRTETVNKLPPLACHLFGIQNQSGGSYDLLWSAAKDYDGTIASYTLVEVKNRASVFDSCNNLDKWQNNGFSVVSGGHNSANCFYSGNEEWKTVSLTTMESVLVKQGDVLSFWKKYDIDEMGLCCAYAEIAEAGQSFSKLETYTGTSNTWTQSKIDLKDYVGKNVLLRFRYAAEYVQDNQGLYVDDITPVGWFEKISFVENITDTSYHISNNPTAHYFYKVKAKDNDGLESAWSNRQDTDGQSGVSDIVTINYNWSLSQNYPNPLSRFTAIRYSLQQAADVKLAIYDIHGKEIRTIVNRKKQAGSYRARWDGRDNTGSRVSSGVYIYRITVGGPSAGPGLRFRKVRRMQVIK